MGNQQRVVIFGTGAFGKMCLSQINDDTQVIAVLDNDIKKQGTSFFGHKICPPAEIISLSYDKIIIAIDAETKIGMERITSIQTQLTELAVSQEKIEIYSKKVVIYGTEAFAKKYFSEIGKGTQVIAVLDDDIQKQGTSFFGHKIYSPIEIANLIYDIIIITIDVETDIGMEKVASIQTQLDKLGVPSEKVEIYAKRTYFEHNSHIVLFAREYLFERCSNRKLLIYGTGTEAKQLTKLLSITNIPVEYYLDEEFTDAFFENKKIRSWSDIAYEDLSGIFIIVANEKESYGVSRQKFMQLGLTEDIEFTYYKQVPDSNEEDFFNYDITLSHNRIRNKSGHKHAIEGFELFGDIDNPKALKIVALGGSTTESSRLFVKGWAQYLTDYFIENGISMVMYCGGIGMYASIQELLKLIRDVIPLNPDIVLSYSGANDLGNYPWQPSVIENDELNNNYYKMLKDPIERTKRPFITKFQINYIKSILSKFPEDKRTVYYGLQNEKTASEFYLDNIRMMQAIAKEFNILFLSFFQPFIYIGDYKITDSQKIILNRYWPNMRKKADSMHMINEAHKIANAIENMDYITNLTHIFSNYANIYKDWCHVNEQGNKIIAKHIYDVLIKHLGIGKSK